MIEIQGLYYKQGSFKLVIDQLSIRPGITLLVGRNGAGKSTFLKLLATALFPQKGTIRYLQKTAEQSLPLIRSCIGYVPTGIELYEEMTPEKLLTYMAELKGVNSPGEVKDLLKRFGFANELKKIKNLSQGQQQKLNIAQAFLGDPLFLFLDEALNYLDSIEKRMVIHEISRIANRKWILISTHEMNDWALDADAILWMDNGRVPFFGSLTEWKSGLPWKVWSGQIDRLDLEEMNKSRLLSFKVSGNKAYIRVIGNHPPFSNMEEQSPTLEDVYFIRKQTGPSF